MDERLQPLQILGRVDIDQLGGGGHDMPPGLDQVARARIAVERQQEIEPLAPEQRRGDGFSPSLDATTASALSAASSIR